MPLVTAKALGVADHQRCSLLRDELIEVIPMRDRDHSLPDFSAAQWSMWELVEKHTNRVGYQRGIKASGLDASPPVIDCSGWVGALLTSGMKAENIAAGREIFGTADIAACVSWSDRILLEIETRTLTLLVGNTITAKTLPRYATIGLNMGDFGWEKNFPRTRGINHIVQVVRRPTDQTPFVSESIGPEGKGGVRLMPLGEWLDAFSSHIFADKAWAVDPFGMANRNAR